MGVTGVAKSIKEWEVQLAIFEFECLKCCAKIERYVYGNISKPAPICECGNQMEPVEWSVPAKRNPEKGIQT